ncbi:MAG: carboxypeptidase regulatory-like domain-containing protein, partial [Sphingobacteriales bacterium]
MQKPIALLAVITILLINLSGLQAQVKIYGAVKDAEGKPVSGVNVLLLNHTDSSLIKGTISLSAGNFSFDNVNPGKYLLGFSFAGYKQVYTATADLNQNDFNAGHIKLHREEKELAAVTVTARKPLFEQKIDRMVINVKNSITSAGGTALEVLEKSPGVIVNHQSNSISLSGKEGVVVMINGKITRMPVDAVVQMLSGMNASNIERIELITTPPANFDAEGNAGFINIVLITNPDNGFNGSYSLTAGYGHGYVPAGAVNFNYRKNKINLFGDYSFTWR